MSLLVHICNSVFTAGKEMLAVDGLPDNKAYAKVVLFKQEFLNCCWQANISWVHSF